MKKIRFLMIGGFLGAGKTTTIAKIAGHYAQAGLSVGLVTNDQAYDLVDTHTLRSQGFTVGEVPGACFCCKFDDLIKTVSDLSDETLPDLVIAEPVGSCTDLYATVIQPMKQMFGDRFELGPLVVLLKPEHGRKILARSDGQKRRGFSPQAEYIFLKQLEEADAIAINKIDKLSEDAVQELVAAVSSRFEATPCVGFSAREGTDFERFIELVETQHHRQRSAMDVDYETYAAGEAELGWLNCQVDAAADEKFPLDDVVLALVKSVGEQLTDAGFETAHLKVLGQTIENAAVANLVSSGEAAELSLASEIKTTAAELLVNARVAADPDKLVESVKTACQRVGQTQGIKLTVSNIQSFRPAKPEPTHRVQGD